MKIIRTISVLLFVAVVTACTSSGDKKDAPNLKKAADLNIQLGSGYLSQGKLKLAKLKLQKALRQDPDNALAHSTMALLLEKVGQIDKVENYYEDALDLDPDNSEIKNNYGTFLCNQSRFDEARKQFKAAIKDPYYKTPTVALMNLGQCEIQAGNMKVAETHLRQALRKNSQAATALYLMGELGIKTKRYLMTRAYMQRYHDIVQPSAKSLWLQIRAEKALGDQKAFKALADNLNKKFPDSDEAGKMMEMFR